MKKMKRQNKSLLNKAFSLIGDPDVSTVQVRQWIIELLSRKEYEFTAAEKNSIVRRIVELKQLGPEYAAITSVIKETMHLISTIERRADSRSKKKLIKETLAYNRAQRIPVIFYLCSYHEKPAPGHKEYQGKVYVDPKWRSALKQYPELDWLEEPIKDYIRSNKLLTVPRVTNNPPYLITRAYCKHFFIALNTWDVLNETLSSIKAEHPEAVMGTGNHSKNWYIKEYRKLIEKLRDSVTQHKDRATVKQ